MKIPNVDSVFDFTDPTVYAIPVFLLFIAVELWIDLKEKAPGFLSFLYNKPFVKQRKKGEIYHLKDSMASIGMGLGSLVIGLGMKTLAFLAYNYIYQNYAIWPELSHFWWVWIPLLLADDFTFYWHHRLSHSVRILWAAHINHHSSQNLNLAVALRQSWAEVLYKYMWYLWLPLLGFHPVLIMTMMSFSLIYQFFQHSKLVGKLGPVEWIFNTPSHHRVHHAVQVKYLDRNHAGILIIWDRMFGTFQVEMEDDQPVYGITENIDTYNPFKIATHEYGNLFRDVKNAPTFKDKINYMIQPPGWSHTGDLKTSKHLRELEQKAQ